MTEELGALQAGECGAQAVVEPRAEAEHADVLAADVERVGIRMAFGVAVGGGEHGGHVAALGHGHPAHVDGPGGDALGHLHRGVPAEALLHGPRGQFGSAHEQVPLLPVPEQRVHREPEQPGGGLETGDQDEQQGVDEFPLGQPPVVGVAHRQQRGGQVVGGPRPAQRDEVGEVRAQRDHGQVGPSPVLRRPHGFQQPPGVLPQPAELPLLLDGHPDEMAYDADGQRMGDEFLEVGGAAVRGGVGEVVEQSRGDVPHGGPQRGDPARAERTADEPS